MWKRSEGQLEGIRRVTRAGQVGRRQFCWKETQNLKLSPGRMQQIVRLFAIVTVVQQYYCSDPLDDRKPGGSFKMFFCDILLQTVNWWPLSPLKVSDSDDEIRQTFFRLLFRNLNFCQNDTLPACEPAHPLAMSTGNVYSFWRTAFWATEHTSDSSDNYRSIPHRSNAIKLSVQLRSHLVRILSGPDFKTVWHLHFKRKHAV